jgi:hypothetical protein
MNEPTDKVNKPQKKYITYCLGFLLGIILTVALIFHFKSTYESNFTTEKALPKLPEITLEPSKSISSLQELSPPSQLACNKDANFILAYYQLKEQAKQGKNFSNELLELNEYQINSNQVKQIFSKLSNLANQNTEDSYFKDKFSSIIRQLCNENEKPANIITSYLNEYFNQLFFIYPFGNRAIKNGGFAMNIELAQQKLIKNNLQAAIPYINELDSQLPEFIEFKQKLINKIAINAYFEEIDKSLEIEAEGK